MIREALEKTKKLHNGADIGTLSSGLLYHIMSAAFFLADHPIQ